MGNNVKGTSIIKGLGFDSFGATLGAFDRSLINGRWSEAHTSSFLHASHVFVPAQAFFAGMRCALGMTPRLLLHRSSAPDTDIMEAAVVFFFHCWC